MDFKPFPKIARLNRNIIITEKIDGTNAQIVVGEDGSVRAGSRTRWITPADDNYGFAKWVKENKEELLHKLGPGQHFGEWWGNGIQRGYNLPKGEKRFSLFNVTRWNDENKPSCCHVVPTLYQGIFNTNVTGVWIDKLIVTGSFAAPGFMKPEGIIIWHEAARQLFKATCVKDEEPKGFVK